MTREKAIEILKGHPPFSEEDFVEWEEAYNMAIEALNLNPVRHGRWIIRADGKPVCTECSCLKLGKYFDKRYFYCPHCGAKMDKVEE